MLSTQLAQTSLTDQTDLPAPPVASVERREAGVLGYRMRYLVAGAGEPVLLLHGLADSGDTWNSILPGLARRYRVFAPDLLGCGASDKPRINYSLWALATYVRHFLDAVGVEKADIVGHSLGAGLALHLFFQYPERVKRLALLAAGGMGRDLPLSLRLCTLAGSSPVIGALLASRHNNHPLARTGRIILRRIWPAAKVADRRVADSGLVETSGKAGVGSESAAACRVADEEDDILERLREPVAREAFLAMLRSVGNIRGQHVTALDQLHLVRAPVMLIHGRRDTTIPLSHGEAAQSYLVEGSLEVLEDCGHCPHREAPTQVLGLLERFFGAPAAAAAAQG